LPAWALGAGISALVCALYLPFLGVPFEYDDKVEILLNRVLREPGNITELLRYNPFRLLLLWTFAIDLWAWGGRPEGYRAVNIAIHLANSLLVLALLRRLGAHWKLDRPALFAGAGGLLFAGHPLAIESVTYISGRSSSLASFFVFASLLCYSRYADLLGQEGRLGEQLRQASRRSARWVALVVASGVAAALPVAYGVRTGQWTVRGAAPTLVTVIGCVLVLAAVLSRQQRGSSETPSQPFLAARKQARLLYAMAMAAFLLGCLCKEIAATAPAVLLLAELCVWQGSWRAALARLGDRLLPFFAVPLLLIVLRIAAYGYVASPSFIRPWQVNLLTQFEVLCHYARLWIVPFPLSIYHEYPVVIPPGTAFTWAAAAGLAGLLWLAVRYRKTAPALSFGLLTAAVTLLPTSSVFALKETMAEHRTYLPSLGYAFAAAWFFSGPIAARLGSRPATLLLAALVLFNSALHVMYDRQWRSEEQLWAHAVRINPEASDAWRYLGDLYLGQGRLDDSKYALGEAVRSRPGNVESLSKLGMIHARSGDLDKGEELFARAIELASCYTPALNNLALVQRKRGDVGRAIEIYHRSILCETANFRAHIGLGDIYYEEMKERQKAADHYSSALETMDPLHPDVSTLKTRLLELTW